MRCPKCESALIKVKVRTRPEYGEDILNDAEQTSEIDIDQCLSCHGVWFDVKELDQYLAEKLVIVNSPKVERYREFNLKDGPCPKCNQLMIKKPAPTRGWFSKFFGGGFKIDVCEKCQGVWLDSFEIEKLEEKNFSMGEKHALVMRNLKKLIFEN